MAWLYQNLLRPVLFQSDSEQIHNRTINSLSRISRTPILRDLVSTLFQPQPLPTTVRGLSFPNPIGLAAGMDKHGTALPAWQALGFGFTELGGVTWHPQPGNPLPRIFRIIPDQAIINRMGFNNPGAAALAQTLNEWKQRQLWPHHPVGINLGKSKITPLTEAAEDYRKSFHTLWPYADFFVVNVSSPNTPNLRQLQDKPALDEILSALQSENQSAASASNTAAKPLFVKIAPDLSFDAIDEIIELALQRRLSGIVATNTTVARPLHPPPALASLYAETGGLSGKPLQSRSTEIIRHIYRQSRGRLIIIGVGGIFSAADAWEKIGAGASLLQLYTSLIYEGPAVVKTIVSGLVQQLSLAGLHSLHQAVGSQSLVL